MLNRFLYTRVRPFNKRVTNPLMLRIAGQAHSPVAVIHHAGRRSGQLYHTPVMLAPVAGGFVFALTYGPKVDWYRNIVAAGQGTLLWHGQRYAVREPETIDAQTALPAFALPFRLMLRLLRIPDFVRMKAAR
jgi:deazaflavin-dependent oxidoreductase (nitroreductase family)